jgi:hypothetical protein
MFNTITKAINKVAPIGTVDIIPLIFILTVYKAYINEFSDLEI